MDRRSKKSERERERKNERHSQCRETVRQRMFCFCFGAVMEMVLQFKESSRNIFKIDKFAQAKKPKRKEKRKREYMESPKWNH